MAPVFRDKEESAVFSIRGLECESPVVGVDGGMRVGGGKEESRRLRRMSSPSSVSTLRLEAMGVTCGKAEPVLSEAHGRGQRLGFKGCWGFLKDAKHNPCCST